ncbi:SsgA family sporulation/cell division regulator, partial [Streptomyces sp. NPDC059909]|uniref:SsgA family sporulation/cell division regulator n=1 Tax=Streptomyces sp. NPDC059909 TaxID=3346998 RepID=UPI0036645CFE
HGRLPRATSTSTRARNHTRPVTCYFTMHTTHCRGVVCIELSSPEGHALLEAPKRAVKAFLKCTDDVVPPGTEHLHFDVDSLTGSFNTVKRSDD